VRNKRFSTQTDETADCRGIWSLDSLRAWWWRYNN
jgi:hypothetical protein